MPQPTTYTRSYDFTDYQEDFPAQPLPAAPLDANLDAASLSINQIITRLSLIQRDDGSLANALVTPDSLATATLNLIGGFNPRGIWATGVVYSTKDAVTNSGSSYVAQTNHTAGASFATDLAAGKWLLIAFGASSTASAFTPTGSTPPTSGMYLAAADTLGFASQSQPALTIANPASAVNYWAMLGAATGNNPSLSVTGTDTNVGANFITKGSGAFSLYTNINVLQAQITHTALAVNYLVMSGGAAGGSPYFTVAGSDTNIGLNVIAKGAGYTKFFSHSSLVQFSIAPIASAVNYLQVAGAVTTGVPLIAALGTDTNIGIEYRVKGIANQTFTSDGTQGMLVLAPVLNGISYFTITAAAAGSYPSIASTSSAGTSGMRFISKGYGGFEFYATGNSSLALSISPAGVGVNNLDIANAPTGASPVLQPIGTDTNIGMNIFVKGIGGLNLYSHSGTIVVAAFNTIASAVNYINFRNNTSGSYPYIQAIGTDTNVGLNFYTQGSGPVNFYTNASAQQQLSITHTVAAVNFLGITGGATGTNTLIQCYGGDATVGVNIATKSTGSLQLSTNGAVRITLDGVSAHTYFYTAAKSTADTGGYVWLTSSPGAPTGAATAPYALAAAFTYDSTNNKIYVRCNGTWRSTAALT